MQVLLRRKERTVKSEWTEVWPQTPGVYWFYGHRFFGQEKQDLYTVKVFKGANCTVYVCEGSFLFKGEGAEGKFMPVVLPALPD
jgi:hypothetical protein